jgi:hypothetical protein
MQPGGWQAGGIVLAVGAAAWMLAAYFADALPGGHDPTPVATVLAISGVALAVAGR